MRQVEKILSQVELCITNNSFTKIENDKLELKDNSSDRSNWKQIYVTACAFLNTTGGIIVIGIKEDEKHSKFDITGFDLRNEELAKAISKKFTDEYNSPLDLSEYFPAFEVHDLAGKKNLAIYVEQLPEEKKYVFFENVAYERLITGDHKINPQKISTQKEYKIELESAKELQIVNNTTLENLDVNKLNDYIQLLNKDVRTDSIKPDINSAKSFLERKSFITATYQPTVLGILVCGKNVDDILASRCQVDGYVDTGISIAENKKVFKDNILPLLERSLNFILQNIQVGVSSDAGGKSIPEYPVRLVRESLNNSLAHRDYSINRFININLVPNKHIEIRNPGRFKSRLVLQDIHAKIPIRRIIPGNSKPNNPKLAEVLKVYDKWEGKGLGMSTLTNECLANNIDLPYYKFHSEDELSLFIRKGKLLDEKMEALIETYEGYIEKKMKGDILTEEQKLVLSYFHKSELENKNERYTILLTKDNNHLDAINSLEDAELIYKHDCSTDLYSVYVIDRVLFKKDHIDELRALFGADFDVLNKDSREILTTIYEFNHYSKDRFPSANKVGNTIWFKMGNANTISEFENFKRKVRSAINQMEKRQLINRVEGKAKYSINTSFKRRSSLYDQD